MRQVRMVVKVQFKNRKTQEHHTNEYVFYGHNKKFCLWLLEETVREWEHYEQWEVAQVKVISCKEV